MGVLSLVFQTLACVGLFLNADKVGDLLDTLDDDDLAAFTAGLGMPGLTKEEIQVRHTI